jgi:hypothetical protein
LTRLMSRPYEQLCIWAIRHFRYIIEVAVDDRRGKLARIVTIKMYNRRV